MASKMIFFCALIFLAFIGKGACGCNLSNIKVTTSVTGKTVNGKTEYKVTVVNDCGCAYLNVKFACVGFQSTEKVDPSILAVDGDTCLVNNGLGLYLDNPIVFFYAWSSEFPFKPLYATIACSGIN